MRAFVPAIADLEGWFRWLKALGGHRYVAGACHEVDPALLRALGGEGDLARLHARAADATALVRVSDAELIAVLRAALCPGEARDRILAAWPEPAGDDALLFDEAREATTAPLIDAGWELLGKRELDPERHRGVVSLAEYATWSEDEVVLQELGLFGLRELRSITDGAALREAPPLWLQGPEFYHEYILTGVARAAKLG
jgi:hypothetical protein